MRSIKLYDVVARSQHCRAGVRLEVTNNVPGILKGNHRTKTETVKKTTEAFSYHA